MKTSIINGSEVSKLSVAIQTRWELAYKKDASHVMAELINTLQMNVPGEHSLVYR